MHRPTSQTKRRQQSVSSLAQSSDPVGGKACHSISDQRAYRSPDHSLPESRTPPSSPQYSEASKETESPQTSPPSSPSFSHLDSTSISHIQLSKRAWQKYAATLKDEEIETDRAIELHWIQAIHEAERERLRAELIVDATSTILAIRHQAASERAWQSYKHALKSEQAESESALCFYWMQRLQTELNTDLFVALTTIKARDVELANDLDDYQAEVDALRDERDEAIAKSARRKTQLKTAMDKCRHIENEAKGLRGDKEQLEKEVGEEQLRNTEAMKIIEDQGNKLYRFQKERDFLASASRPAEVLMDQQIQIGQLQNAARDTRRENGELCQAYGALLAQQLEKDEEIKKLQADFRSARLEADYLYVQNSFYRDITEDHPEQTAHLDGLLKRKAEIYDDLVERYDECMQQKEEEQKLREIDNELSSGNLAALEREIGALKKENDELERSRDSYQKSNEGVLQMLGKDLLPEDLTEALNEEYELLKKDNAFLIQMVRSREATMEESIAEISLLKVEIIELKDGLEDRKNEQRQLQARASELDIHKQNLEMSIESLKATHEQQVKDLETELQDERQKLLDIIKDASSPSIQFFLDGKDREINDLRTTLANVESNAWYYHNKAVELEAEFDPLFDFRRLGEGNWVLVMKRMEVAERLLNEQEARLKAKGLWEEIRGDVDPRHRELEEAQNFLRHM